MRLRLGDVFSKTKSGDLYSGWIYFREKTNPTLDTECFLVAGDEVDYDDDGVPLKARAAGYVEEGLDTETIQDCLLCAEQFGQVHNASLELEAFIYYWKFDAFLPYPGAPDPPPPGIAMLNADREFYEGLGEEIKANPCRNPGCERGAVQYSVLCRVHHFESIKRRPCPFFD